ncbi:hypothetical protein PF004_g16493 [Phytophthora fragariae]|uniref:Uncharacterized protein n=1 Tax=Phytophthora fragariae TaxID=53985 RepID=A0A6G0NI67_9STRA|nr:hypothetical protein PF004_g16493 [Phytophthora fragariae]
MFNWTGTHARPAPGCAGSFRLKSTCLSCVGRRNPSEAPVLKPNTERSRLERQEASPPSDGVRIPSSRHCAPAARLSSLEARPRAANYLKYMSSLCNRPVRGEGSAPPCDARARERLCQVKNTGGAKSQRSPPLASKCWRNAQGSVEKFPRRMQSSRSLPSPESCRLSSFLLSARPNAAACQLLRRVSSSCRVPFERVWD